MKELSQQPHEAKGLAVFSHVQGTFGEKFVLQGGEETYSPPREAKQVGHLLVSVLTTAKLLT